MVLVRDLLGVRHLNVRVLRGLALVIGLSLPLGATALAQSDTKPAATESKPAATDTKPADKPAETKPAPATPDTKAPPSSTPTNAAPAQAPATPSPKTPEAAPAPTTPAPAPDAKTPPPPAPDGKSHDTEIEPNGSPGIPQNAQTESVDVPKRPVVVVSGRSSYDDAFKSIKASLETVKKAMDKAGLKPAGHPITIFSEPDDKGFKYKAAIPIAKPDGKPDFDAKNLGADVTIGESPAGKAIKFQHRGAYEDIDSTYDVITAYLDAKGLQVDNPYIEEYLTDLSTPDDPNLQVDIYVFVKP